MIKKIVSKNRYKKYENGDSFHPFLMPGNSRRYKRMIEDDDDDKDIQEEEDEEESSTLSRLQESIDGEIGGDDEDE